MKIYTHAGGAGQSLAKPGSTRFLRLFLLAALLAASVPGGSVRRLPHENITRGADAPRSMEHEASASRIDDARGADAHALPGVSRELAAVRYAAITNLRYALHFALPPDTSQRVEGRVAISFTIERPQDVVLDFKASAAAIRSIRVGGRRTPYIYRDEHITLPATSFRRAGEQRVEIVFTAGDQSLNRRPDLMYTLLVPDRARTLFPCFDQPDMKARYTLSLTLPAQWTAVSNTSVKAESRGEQTKTIAFAETEPLSTYLFSFVAGRLQRATFADPAGRRISCYHRESDTAKVAQLPGIARQVFAALAWQERFTGIAYPFAKYDLIILPGFQFGGMEHTGATLYNDRQLFLSPHPTPSELFSRAQLIAHETSHMWFGDLVTMRWFDDVWTKEVFANYFAARITADDASLRFSSRLNTMRDYTARALAQDRTPGTTAIGQRLDNLSDAGLVYNDIIYCKSPLVMEKIVELMGEEAFREGIRRYLRRFSYSNATWDDLVATLDSLTPRDLRRFSRAWVGSSGMPHITLSVHGDTLLARQHDPQGRGITWPQSFGVRAWGVGRLPHESLTSREADASRSTERGASAPREAKRREADASRSTDTTVAVTFGDDDSLVAVPLGFTPTLILPNTDGRGYGRIDTDTASRRWLLNRWHTLPEPVARLAAVMQLGEHYLACHSSDSLWLASLIRGLEAERDPLLAQAIAGYLDTPLRQCDAPSAEHCAGKDSCPPWNARLWHLSRHHPLPAVRTTLLRLMFTRHTSAAVTDSLRRLWQERQCTDLSESDYTSLAYQLALRLPAERDDILARERGHIKNADRLRQLDFIAPFTTRDTARADSLFRTLLRAENRRPEPWALAALRLLTHPVRGSHGAAYILPGLEALPDIQRTGDIFMPTNWCRALLAGASPDEAATAVAAFLNQNPGIKPLLRGKVLGALPPFTDGVSTLLKPVREP